MKDKEWTHNLKRHQDLAKFCGLLGSPTRIAILEKLNVEGTSKDYALVSIVGLSEYTVGMNIKYLKKYKLIKRELISKKVYYCVNYETLDEFKKLFDEFYELLKQNKIEVPNEMEK